MEVLFVIALCSGLWIVMQIVNAAFGKTIGTLTGLGCILIPLGIVAAVAAIGVIAIALPLVIAIVVLVSLGCAVFSSRSGRRRRS